MKRRTIRTIITCTISVILLVALIVGNVIALRYSDIISIKLGHSAFKVKTVGEVDDTEYFKSEFTSKEQRIAAEEALCREIEAEGIVLLKNNNSSLPLGSQSKISLFGVDSRDFIYGGTGSGSVDTGSAPTLQAALEQSDFKINQVLVDFYKTGRGKSFANTTADISGGGAYKINEAPGQAFTSTVKDSFAEYSDAAVVVFNRAGSESSDLPKASANDQSRSYLELTADEESLLELVASSSFKKVVVIINSATPMELGFLNNTAYKIDACIWVGNVGQTGMYAIGDVLNGTVNPSGGLVDTYAYDTLGAPAIKNQANYIITNAVNTKGSAYMVYAEGIYIGYRYYETRYEDSVLGTGNASANVGVTSAKNSTWNYTDEVQFPFGFGLSYTDFEWSGYDITEKDNGYEVKITVKNSGDTAGKDIVQLYMQSPYTEYDKQNGIEKASVELVGYAKTKLLNPDESETMTIHVSKEQLKTYDAKTAMSYIIESGDYYFTVADNAHSAINNILTVKGKTIADGMDSQGNSELARTVSVVADNTEYTFSQATGNSITNQFKDADIKTYDDKFQYLSRNDWEATYPQTYQSGKWSAPDEIITGVEIAFIDKDDSIEKPVQNKDNGLTLAMFMDEEIPEESWNDLLDQMSYDDLVKLVKDGGYMTQPITSVSAPGALNLDGPAGILSAAGISVTLDEPTFSWVSEVVLAATWNNGLAERMGEMVGEDALANSKKNQRVGGWYAPAMNIHRTAYSGRNFEYYSEDSFLSGAMGAAETKGATSKGLICYIKHFALNDQETNRTGLVTMANEQTIREIYLKPFEIAIREGGALGVMVSMNRIGVKWAGSHKGLMTDTLKDEWGFKGIAVTDQASFASFSYEDIREGLAAGTTMWLNTDASLWLDKLGDYSNNSLLLTQLRTAAKDILYAVSNSLAMNGVSANTKIVVQTPLWQYWLYTADGLIVLILILVNIMVFKGKKKKEPVISVI